MIVHHEGYPVTEGVLLPVVLKTQLDIIAVSARVSKL
jgi:hypothetical protein